MNASNNKTIQELEQIILGLIPFWGDPGRRTGAGMGEPADFGANPLYSCYNSEKRGISIDLKSEFIGYIGSIRR